MEEADSKFSGNADRGLPNSIQLPQTHFTLLENQGLGWAMGVRIQNHDLWTLMEWPGTPSEGQKP